MDEARLERTDFGTAAATEGWFAVNLRDAAWVTSDDFGAACIFEGEAAPFAQVGYTVAVLQPGQPNGMYHREDDQEDFLVLSGECLLIVEGVERRLRAWDFVHCPAGTEHIFVGAGDGPCAILMIGGRPQERRTLHYPVSEVAAKHGASTAQETPNPDEAYADWPGDYDLVRLPWPVE
jgi:uncharacterized cupin superfamily protein